MFYFQALDTSTPPWEAVMRSHRTPRRPHPARSAQSEKDSVLSWRFPSGKDLELRILLLFLLCLFCHNWGVGGLLLQVGQEVAELTNALKQLNTRQQIRANTEKRSCFRGKTATLRADSGPIELKTCRRNSPRISLGSSSVQLERNKWWGN